MLITTSWHGSGITLSVSQFEFGREAVNLLGLASLTLSTMRSGAVIAGLYIGDCRLLGVHVNLDVLDARFPHSCQTFGEFLHCPPSLFPNPNVLFSTNDGLLWSTLIIQARDMHQTSASADLSLDLDD